MTDRWRVCSPGYLLPPYLLHNYCLQTHPSALACRAAVDGKVRREGARPGASQELLRTHSSSSSSSSWPAATPINGQGVESRAWSFLPFVRQFSISKHCIEWVSYNRTAKINICQDTTYISVMNIFGLLNSEIIS